MDTEGNRMSSTRDMEADRLARVKLSCTIEPGDLRVTGLRWERARPDLHLVRRPRRRRGDCIGERGVR